MVFSSTIFLFIFLPITLIGYFIINPNLRNIFLLFMSLIFYAWGEPKFVFILILSILANYTFALLIDKHRNSNRICKALLLFMFLFNISIFFIFKYLAFSVMNINKILGTSIIVPKIVLPIGISFFTFQAMSYVVDVYRQKAEPQKNPLDVGLYIAFFPQLVAGPIVRYETIAKEIKQRTESLTDFTSGMTRFIIGLSKKVLISNVLAIIADRYYAITDYSQLSVAGAWLGSLCYSLQIFFDFSGYSDMAIGLGMMFGFHFPENFNYPYIAKSISDFWRRWHITLSTWFRDYVYIPLGGNRVSKGRLIINLFLVWLLTGVWHGASWNFVCWGLYYFLILLFEKMTGLPQKLKSKTMCLLYRIFTLLLINFGWVLFRASTLNNAMHYVLSMLHLSNNNFTDDKTIFIFQDISLILLISFIGCVPWKKQIEKLLEHTQCCRYIFEFLRSIFLILLLIFSISYCVNGSYNPFIYFNF